MPIEFTRPWDREITSILPEQADEATRKRYGIREGNCMKCNRPILLWNVVIGGVDCGGQKHCDECIEVFQNTRRARGTKRTFQDSDRKKEHAQAYALARAWKPLTTNIYLQGDVGTGKSFLTDCILHKCRTLEMSTLCMTGLDFCKLFNAQKFGQHSNDFLYQTDVLALDDVDKAPWFNTNLYELWQMLNVRRQKQKSTIFSTNFDEGTLLNYFGEFVPKNLTLPRAIMDRLRPVLNIKMVGESLRKYEKTLQEANQQQELF